MSEEILSETGKKDLINTLNKTGYMLEEKAYKLVKDLGAISNVVFYTDSGRIEIDLVHSQGGVFFLIECKRTEYDWIFTHGIDNKKKIELTKIQDGKFSMVKYPSNQYKITKHQIALKIGEDGLVEKPNKKDVMRSTEDFNKAVYQLLNNIDVYLEKTSIVGLNYIIPVIVTNAKLFFMEYEENQINDQGNLQDCKLSPEKRLVFNFPFITKWQEKDYQSDRGAGLPSIKSIFVVNIEEFREFVIKLIDSLS